MIQKRLSLVLFAIPLVAVAALTVAANRPHLASMAPASDPTCSSASPCIQYQNTGSGPAIRGIGGTGNGVSGEAIVNSTSSTGRAGVIGADTSGNSSYSSNWGVKGTSTYGTGVEGDSTKFVGVNAVGGGQISTIRGLPVFYPALSIVGDMSCTPCVANDLIDACQSGGANPCDFAHSVFTVSQGGNVLMAGELIVGGSCRLGCEVGSTQVNRVRFYTARESLPTVEDFGEAQLTAGRAYVRLDPAFADTIDQHAKYLVFITPEGDANTLFVNQKSGNGFSVTESSSGRHSIAFQYRIVAKPYGETATRLQRIVIHVPTASGARFPPGTLPVR